MLELKQLILFHLIKLISLCISTKLTKNIEQVEKLAEYELVRVGVVGPQGLQEVVYHKPPKIK